MFYAKKAHPAWHPLTVHTSGRAIF